MFAPNIVIPLILTVNAGANKFALGLDDASRFDRIALATSAIDFVPEASTVAGADTVGKQKSLRGIDGADVNVSTETGLPNDTDRTVEAKKIDRSVRLGGASVRVSRLPE